MRTVRLAHRDNDRTPVIYCIKAMAERYYGVHVEVNTNETAAHGYGIDGLIADIL
jgi:hypothetical protein